MPVDGSAYNRKQSTSPVKSVTNRMRQENSRMSIESLTSNGNNVNSRRKLPTLPPAKQLPQIPQSRVKGTPFLKV